MKMLQRQAHLHRPIIRYDVKWPCDASFRFLMRRPSLAAGVVSFVFHGSWPRFIFAQSNLSLTGAACPAFIQIWQLGRARSAPWRGVQLSAFQAPIGTPPL